MKTMNQFCPHCGKEIKEDESKLIAESRFKQWPNSAGNNITLPYNFYFNQKYTNAGANPGYLPLEFQFIVNQ